MLSRCTNTDCLEYGIKRCRVSRAIHRIICGGFPPIKGVSLVNIRLGYHGIPSADRMYLLTPSLSDVQPSPCQTCCVVGHLQTTCHQRVAHLFSGKEPRFVTFNVVLGTFWCANEVMHVHRGQPSINEADIDPCNLQVRFVNKSCMNRPWSPGLWCEPRFDQ